MLQALIGPVTGLLDKFIEDKDQKAKLAHEIATMAEKQTLQEAADTTARRLVTADKLTSGLADEQSRWTGTAETLRTQLGAASPHLLYVSVHALDAVRVVFAGPACAAEVVVERVRQGSLDPQLSGGEIEGVQMRRQTIYLYK